MISKKTAVIFLLFLSSLISAQTITFTAGPNLSDQRMSHRMELLPDGKLLIMGGNNGSIENHLYFSSCQLYDPSANTFLPVPSMSVERSDFMSVVLNDGSILAAGGNNDAAYGNTSCEIFDPLTLTWSLTTSLKEAHWGGAGLKLNDGRVLVAGGNTLKTELYNSYTRSWSYGGEMTVNHGPGMTLTLLKDGNVLAAGGEYAPTVLEIFSPSSGAWSKVAYASAYKHQHHGAALLPDGKVLLAGSSYFSTADQLGTEIFNPVTNNVTVTGNMLTNTSYLEMEVMDNGRVLTFGLGDIFSLGNTKMFQEYNPSTGTWSSGTYNQIGASSYAMKKLGNGNIFISGGNFTTGNGASQGTIIVRQTGYNDCTPADLSIILNGGSSSDCYGKGTAVTTNTSEIDVGYSLYSGSNLVTSLTGSGQSLEFTIPSTYLLPGKNIFKVEVAKQGCLKSLLKNTITLNQELKNLSNTRIVLTSGTTLLCSATSKAGFSVELPGTGTYQWNNGITGTTNEVSQSGLVTARNIDANGCAGNTSEGIVVRKISSSDVVAGEAFTLCEVANPVQLEGNPAGGTWTGTGVNSSGLFTPSSAGPGTYYLTYTFCNYPVNRTITVQSKNNINFDPADLSWPANDTLCGGSQLNLYPQISRSEYYYEFYVNDSLRASGSGGNFYPGYTPDRETQATIAYKIRKYNPSYSCPRDSFTISKTFKVLPKPLSTVQVLFPDSACYLWPAQIRLVKPEKGVIYYAAFYPESWPENQGPKISTATAVDTLLLPSRGMGWPSGTSNITVYATPGIGCIKATNVYLGQKEVSSYDPVTSVDLSDIYYVGQKVSPVTTSIMDSYLWDVDGVTSSSRNVPSAVYSSTGKHLYTLLAKSKYGCVDTVRKEIAIVRKPVLPSQSTCQFDTTQIPYTHEIFKTIIDRKGNTIIVGHKYVDYAGNYSGSYNGIIEKYPKQGGKALWRLAHSPFYAGSRDFYSMFITGVTTDESNNIYITGSYVGTGLQFAGLTISNTESETAYGHAFVAKLSEDGQVQWFIYSNDAPGELNTTREVGGADILFHQGKLYVSARMLQQKLWKNQAGQTISHLNAEQVSEYTIFELNLTGTVIKALANINSDSYYSTINALYSPSNSSYYTTKIAVLSPNLHPLPGGNIAVSGTIRGPVYFGNVLLTPDSIPGNTQSFVFTEFTGVIDPAAGGWKSTRLESGSNSKPFERDKLYSAAAYTSAAEKVSAINTGDYYYGEGSLNNTYTIRLNRTESIFHKEKATLLKKVDKDGNILWKRFLKNAFIHRVFLSTDSSQVIAVGEFKYGIGIEFGDQEFGVTGGQNHDLYAMGFHLQTGSLVWAERISSQEYDDFYYASALSDCNELLLMGYRSRFYLYGKPNAVGHEQDSIRFYTDNPYVIRIPLTGTCSPANCKVLTGVTAQIDNSETLLLYPNPSADHFNVLMSSQLKCQKLTIKDLAGRTIQTFDYGNASEIRVDVHDFMQGIYVVEVLADGKISHHKLYLRK